MSNNKPADWPRISSSVFYDDPSAAIDFLERAFGFVTRLRIDGDDGRVLHSELEYGPDGLVMVGSSGTRPQQQSPRTVGANTQAVMVIVEGDIDAHHDRALAAGARVFQPLETKSYGDRTYGAFDPEGHMWWFSVRVDAAAWARETAPYRRK